MEMLATEYIIPRNTGYMRIVGKSIWENPSHPSRVGGMDGPVQPQAGHPAPLAGLLLAKAQQGRHPKDVK